MIKSMTGYAREEREFDGGQLNCELRAVNHRFLDLHLRLPDELRSFESDIRAAVSARLQRGKVDVVLRYQPALGAAAGLALDPRRMQQLRDACRAVEGVFGATAPVDPLAVLEWPGVINEVPVDAQRLQAPVFALLDRALNQLESARAREGARLADLLSEKTTSVAALCEKVRQRLPRVHDAWRERLRMRLAELDTTAVDPDNGRLEQEMLMLAQRMDVDEELSRLLGHCEEMHRTLKQTAAVGRRMDFLMQEFNREANTLSSKSQDTEITRMALEMKVLIEQMREQVQNIE